MAKVRIAPTEKWCPVYADILREHPSMGRLVGLEVEIIPSSMETRTTKSEGDHDMPLPFSLWEAEQESINAMNSAIGAPYSDGGPKLCEHILEMD